jgi:iron complex transport system permease protein
MMKLNRRLLYLLGFIIVVPVLFTGALSMGIIQLSFEETARILMRILLSADDTLGIHQDLVQYLRLPRFYLAIIVGCGLSVCGAVMQAVLRNPLADPYLLGISAGACLGAVIAISTGAGTAFGYDSVGIYAALGAVGVSAVMLLISSWGGKNNALALLFTGLAMNAACSAAVVFLITVLSDPRKTQSVQFWLMGNLAYVGWLEFMVLCFVVGSGVFLFWTQSRILNLMLLGDAVSLTLGRNLVLYRNFYIAINAVMIGFIVYYSGMIGFVGLIIPHMVRLLTGTHYKKLIPFSALAGGCFLAWADVSSRIILPGRDLPIGVVVSLIGAPFFIYLLVAGRGFGGSR